MDARPAKRSRPVDESTGDLACEGQASLHHTSEDATSSIPTRSDFDVMLDEMSEDSIVELLLRLAREMPAVATALTRAHHEEMTTPVPALDFDPYSKLAWRALAQCERLRSSQQSEMAYSTIETVWGYFQTIDEETQAPNCAFQTKQSGLETIRKITKSLLLSGDILGKEIRSELYHDTTIPDLMIAILNSMVPAERTIVGSSSDEKGTLITKVEWLDKEAKAYCLDGLAGLEEVISLMSS